jgi:dTDP-4-amino-4,6-dideoxygalactose transaminase
MSNSVAEQKKSSEIPFGRPWIGREEKEAVLAVLDSPILTHGPKGKEFEKGFEAFMGGGHAISTSSCMASLHLAALDLRLGPGDEVLVPAMTHVATVHAVELTGAKPIFVDCETVTGNVDPEKLEAALTPKTKAAFIVHFAGIPADMEKILRITGARGIPVVEDCALAVGARIGGTHVGLLGILGCYSFYPVKHITTGEGGMLVSSDAHRLNRIARFRAFNVDRTHAERSIPGFYEVTGVGMNYRMSELQAALGCAQIKRIPEILKRRAANFAVLRQGLSQREDLALLDSPGSGRTSSHYCAVVLLKGCLGKKRNELVQKLNAKGVGTSIYYPHPVPRFRYYAEKYGYQAGRFPGAESVADASVSLPVGPHLDERQMAGILHALHEALREIQ